MGVNLSIKNAPESLVALLKERAAKNHRSLQGELMVILEEAVRPARAMSIDDVASAVRRLDLVTPAESATMIRDDRK